MTHNTHIAALITAMLASTSLSAKPYATGMTPFEVRDTAGTRHLDGFVWYPTGADAATERAHGNAVWEAIRVAPYADPVAGIYPLVVMSHGMFGNARNQAWLAEELVAKGFIVAAIDHPGTSTFQRDPDHRRELWDRPRDISRAIDHLTQSSDLAGLIDDSRIYMAGHSLGGFTAVALAGGRFDADRFDAFCAGAPDDLACRILDEWDVAKSPEDRVTIAQDLSDDRIKAVAVFDLGGAQTFSTSSLGAVVAPMLVYGAPITSSGLDLDVESRALVAALPEDRTTYHEPAGLAHFDFLGTCTEQGLAILKEEEPDDAFDCEGGRDTRRDKHDRIAQEVSAFFNSH